MPRFKTARVLAIEDGWEMLGRGQEPEGMVLGVVNSVDRRGDNRYWFVNEGRGKGILLRAASKEEAWRILHSFRKVL